MIVIIAVVTCCSLAVKQYLVLVKICPDYTFQFILIMPQPYLRRIFSKFR